MKLAISKVRQQIIDGGLDVSVILVNEDCRILPKLSIFAVCLFVALNCRAEVNSPPDAQLTPDKIEVSLRGLGAEWTWVSEVRFKQGYDSIRNIDELLPASERQRIPVIESGPENRAKNKASQGEGPRPSVSESINFTDHYPSLSLVLFNFSAGIFLVLFFGFVQHARRHGVNNAWRDLVFNWPIPYWMRFVPAEERAPGYMSPGSWDRYINLRNDYGGFKNFYFTHKGKLLCAQHHHAYRLDWHLRRPIIYWPYFALRGER